MGGQQGWPLHGRRVWQREDDVLVYEVVRGCWCVYSVRHRGQRLLV